MSSGAPEKKQERDYTPDVQKIVPEAEALAKSGKLQDALDKLLALEKQTRNAADLSSTTTLLLTLLRLIRTTPSPSQCDWTQLNAHIVTLSKKHGQLKQAITRMVQEAMKYLDELDDADPRKVQLIETLRTVTEGKIFVEVERARVTRLYSRLLESSGDESKAADVLQELQVETFGSMDRKEKTEFILEQMRLTFQKGDYNRTAIISRKINTKWLKDAENEELKHRFYDLMIRYALREAKHLDVCRYYWEVYDTPSVKSDTTRAKDVLQNIVTFIVLSPYDNEQSDLMARIKAMTDLDQVPEYSNLLKCFTTPELMRWPGIESLYGATLRSTPTFAPGADEGRGDKRWEELHKRVIEHNIRVISKYYTRISLSRLTELLDLSPDRTESHLSSLVSSGTVRAKIDRPAGLVSFARNRNTDEVLNDWSSDVEKLLGLVEKTSHLISKEYALHSAGIAVKDK